ncbi:type II secretion system F family protein [Nocardiopsis sp. HNM0947]|uniref:Type II secretion system F family protein n=1 Tax=Nocardiopsis coralli TaxID=2772213 RepID=A0ABR9P017_9ACTN|nr:type II secretion system F family protein [Nocardiopsis coralli]MBE2997181.1 type II secretion system F family protein [Nocardiopsis coralli]
MTTPVLLLGGLGGLSAGAGLALALLVGAERARNRTRSLSGRLHLHRTSAPHLLGAVAAGLLCWVLTGWPVGGVLAGAGVWWLPALLGPDRAHAAQVARVEAVAAWTEQLRDLMEGAAGLHQAIVSTVPTAPPLIRADVSRLADALQQGTPPEQALAEFAEQVDVPTADLVTAALSTAATRQAADLGALLSSLARSARDQAAMLVRVAATRARVRTSARIIAGTTLALAVGLTVVNADYLDPFDTVFGQVVLAVIGVLWAVGLVWLSRLARTDLGPRALARTRTRTGGEVPA